MKYLREHLIATGRIRPAGTTGGDAYGALRREMVRDARIVTPNDDGKTYADCYWSMVARWWSKEDRRWESPRKRGGVWS